MEMRAKNILQSGVEMDSQQQQFCLKWNSFGSNLATSFSNLFKSESLADVTLFCEGVTFKAHKLILAACSKHLADLFETAPLHQNLLVILDGTSATNMSALLEFMYKGEVHVSQDALSSFLKAAECLQVKGLSIEHEKLAVAQSHTNMDTLDSPTARKQLRVLNEEGEGSSLQQSSPSPSSYSPYLHAHHFRQYEQRIPTSSSTSFEPASKRSLRSPNELLQETVRASVLRDGSKAGRPGSPGPMSLAYRPSSSSSCPLPQQPEADGPPENRFNSETTATALICPESSSNEQCRDPGCPEDLRMKIEPLVQEEPLSSTGNAIGSNGAAANGSLGPLPNYEIDRDKTDLIPSTLWNSVTGKLSSKTGSVTTPDGKVANFRHYEIDRDKADLIPSTLWNSVTGKLSSKIGSITTPDGKKLKCPFCERLYGYETNLRAHIRQRHQGIRVPCPFCSRTFTRNNTVRRHIAREHKTELSMKAFQQSQQAHNHNQ